MTAFKPIRSFIHEFVTLTRDVWPFTRVVPNMNPNSCSERTLNRWSFIRGMRPRSRVPFSPSSSWAGPCLSWRTCTGRRTRLWPRRSRSSTWRMWRTGTGRWSHRCSGGSYRTQKLWCTKTSLWLFTNCCTYTRVIIHTLFVRFCDSWAASSQLAWVERRLFWVLRYCS